MLGTFSLKETAVLLDFVQIRGGGLNFQLYFRLYIYSYIIMYK